MSPRKIEINKLPTRGEDVPIFEFVMEVLPTVIEFMNIWARAIPQMTNILVVRYEDMRLQPELAMTRILEFIGTPGSDDQIRDAVAFSSYENMKKLEEENAFGDKSLVPGDKGNPNSYKVRRGKVGGYRDYFNDRELTTIDELVRTGLSPHYMVMEERAQRLLMSPV